MFQPSLVLLLSSIGLCTVLCHKASIYTMPYGCLQSNAKKGHIAQNLWSCLGCNIISALFFVTHPWDGADSGCKPCVILCEWSLYCFSLSCASYVQTAKHWLDKKSIEFEFVFWAYFVVLDDFSLLGKFSLGSFVYSMFFARVWCCVTLESYSLQQRSYELMHMSTRRNRQREVEAYIFFFSYGLTQQSKSTTFPIEMIFFSFVTTLIHK